MRFKSVSSVQSDTYRAGAEIGDALREIVPEAVLLFASIRYGQGFADRFDAPSRLDPASGAIAMFGSIEQGRSVRVCTASFRNETFAAWAFGGSG